MASVFPLFKLNGLLTVREHRDCHAVVDGSNMFHNLASQNWLSDFAEYGDRVRSFFAWLRNSNITPHVLLDGPSRGDELKNVRSRRRREERVRKLAAFASGTDLRFDFTPTCLHNIFQDIVTELGIEILQVVGNRDFTVEIVAYAKHLDAIVISQNTKFFIQDIPRGCVSIDGDRKFNPSSPFRGLTAYCRDFTARLRLDKAKNPDAVAMWFAIMQSSKNGCEYFDKFISSLRNTNYMNSNSIALNVPRNKPFLRSSVNVLEFLCQHTASEVERIIGSKLTGHEREAAILLLQQSRAAYNVPAEDVFERMDSGIDSLAHFDHELPSWFIRDIAIKSKIMPGLMDTILTRRHLLVVLLEDLSREASSQASIRLRRIIYAILLGSIGADLDGNDAFIKELDRVGLELKEKPVAPLCTLWDPENPDSPVEVPALADVETLSADQKIKCFLLGMTVRESLKEKYPLKSLYFVAVLKFWVNCAPQIGRRDVINVLLTLLLLEKRRSVESGVFVRRVSLRRNADWEAFDEDRGIFDIKLERMHPSAQLQGVMLFARMLHRVLQEPLGEGADAIWECFSERVFHHVCGRTEASAETEYEATEELDILLDELLDEKNKATFNETFDLIWSTEDQDYADQMLDNDTPDFEDLDEDF